MRFTLIAFTAMMAAPALGAIGAKFQMCSDKDCNECDKKVYYYGDDTGAICVDTQGKYAAAWMWPASETEGTVGMAGLWSKKSGDDECGQKDVQDGCSSIKVGSDGSCMEFMTPGGDNPPQMSFQRANNCFAG